MQTPNTLIFAEINADPEITRINEFSEMLGQAEEHRVVETALDMDSREPVQDAVRQFSTMGVGGTPSLYFSSRHQALTEAGAAKFIPRQSREGTASGHGVFFGDLYFEDGSAIPVAVKPHQDESVESCATDYFAGEAARELELETLDTLGMLVGHGGDKAYSMSILYEGLSTLDSIDWKVAEERRPELMLVWGQIARYTALLHSRGSASHGDLALRNIAVASDNGSVFLIDWEKGRLSNIPPIDAEGRYQNSRPDLGELMESMTRRPRPNGKAGIGFLTDRQDPWKDFCTLVFDEYVSVRLDSAAPKELYDVQDELVELEKSLKNHMQLVLHEEGVTN